MMPHPIISGERIWCPFCKDHVRLLKVQIAAKFLDVNRRTIYRYIENNKVYAVRTVGATYRVCSSCLLKQSMDD